MAATTGATTVLFALVAAAGADFDDTREFREEQQQRTNNKHTNTRIGFRVRYTSGKPPREPWGKSTLKI